MFSFASQPDTCYCPNAVDDRDGAGRLGQCGRHHPDFLWNKLDKRFDELKDDLAKLDDRQREDNKALNEKLYRLLESRSPATR
ncbi:MAG: hypothetical protein F4X84_07710 [Synechococcus sp. SB0662_bin_45]|uniref:Uncharacterized protein n=1 Tax=Synechococcus sp. SB0676_bin_10 TaxID=2604869 RepID=A0A6B1F8P5_9SYNE|nr:hypothetical protein [Cyanobacteria bacterium MAG IRC3_bin_20]MDE0646793.1 hypothetical protein [Cyanobacteria bacterium MAG IRC4_bin_6]MXW13187.1 hypothetical protein [Synechococcus sp. SB0668_bin_13]MYE22212.1 hypothetical protein [Synechococcus sp. SB0662_bin_45]MYG39149.1 hypothetical protein [Synechococcus sp. SB0676_bin_10]MYK06870.1 hypothetical protein [Synechococcus sp. SB0670_bin_20]